MLYGYGGYGPDPTTVVTKHFFKFFEKWLPFRVISRREFGANLLNPMGIVRNLHAVECHPSQSPGIPQIP